MLTEVRAHGNRLGGYRFERAHERRDVGRSRTIDADGLDARERVEFRGDIAPAQFFAEVDMLVSPITVDAQPQIVLAALCAGIPVVAANAGAFKDALEGLDVGWLVPDDVAGFAQGVRDAWSHIDAAWEGAMAQRGGARAKYAREVVLQQTLTRYNELANLNRT